MNTRIQESFKAKSHLNTYCCVLIVTLAVLIMETSHSLESNKKGSVVIRLHVQQNTRVPIAQLVDQGRLQHQGHEFNTQQTHILMESILLYFIAHKHKESIVYKYNHIFYCIQLEISIRILLYKSIHILLYSIVYKYMYSIV